MHVQVGAWQHLPSTGLHALLSASRTVLQTSESRECLQPFWEFMTSSGWSINIRRVESTSDLDTFETYRVTLPICNAFAKSNLPSLALTAVILL